jgi:hypothetical protein
MSDHTGRGWVFGDERCPYPGGCNLPLRTHTHHSERPGDPFHVVYYDDLVDSASPSSAPSGAGD